MESTAQFQALLAYDRSVPTDEYTTKRSFLQAQSSGEVGHMHGIDHYSSTGAPSGDDLSQMLHQVYRYVPENTSQPLLVATAARCTESSQVGASGTSSASGWSSEAKSIPGIGSINAMTDELAGLAVNDSKRKRPGDEWEPARRRGSAHSQHQKSDSSDDDMLVGASDICPRPDTELVQPISTPVLQVRSLRASSLTQIAGGLQTCSLQLITNVDDVEDFETSDMVSFGDIIQQFEDLSASSRRREPSGARAGSGGGESHGEWRPSRTCNIRPAYQFADRVRRTLQASTSAFLRDGSACGGDAGCMGGVTDGMEGDFVSVAACSPSATAAPIPSRRSVVDNHPCINAGRRSPASMAIQAEQLPTRATVMRTSMEELCLRSDTMSIHSFLHRQHSQNSQNTVGSSGTDATCDDLGLGLGLGLGQGPVPTSPSSHYFNHFSRPEPTPVATTAPVASVMGRGSEESQTSVWSLRGGGRGGLDDI